jgi:hypothetical protein
MVLGCRCIDMSKGILTILKYTLVAIVPRMGARSNRPPCTLPHLTKYIETLKDSRLFIYYVSLQPISKQVFFCRGVPKSAGTPNSESLAPVACQDFRHQAREVLEPHSLTLLPCDTRYARHDAVRSTQYGSSK